MQRFDRVDSTSSDLLPGQIALLQKLLKAGFKFVTLMRFERYLGVEKENFIALLQPAEGRLEVFTQMGLRMGEGIGVLVDRREGKAFVWHGSSVAATPELLAAYTRVKEELRALVEAGERDD